MFGSIELLQTVPASIDNELNLCGAFGDIIGGSKERALGALSVLQLPIA